MVSSAENKVLTEAPENGERTDYDASNPVSIKEKARAKERRDENARAGLRQLMSTPEGRIYMWDLLATCGVYSTSFHTSNSVMAFNEGKRQIGLSVLAGVSRECPDLYLKMQAEHQPDKEII